MQLPDQLLAELAKVPTFSPAAFCAAHELPAVVSLRRHPVKGRGVFPEATAVPWCAEGVYLDERPVFTLDPAYHTGAYYVQEASSMFLHHLLNHAVAEKAGLRVLDLCAAPGGKSTLLASWLGGEGLLVSNEVIRQRSGVLEENMTRWGYANQFVTCNDPRDFSALEGCFDIIVVDAPCSGSGLFRKDADALGHWSPDNVTLCGARQERILADIYPALKEGGLLIYATCSYSPREDEQMLDWLATQYSMQSVAVPVDASWGIVTTTSPIQQCTGYRFQPDRLRGEGFFAGALRKTGAAVPAALKKFKSQENKKLAAQAAAMLRPGDWVYLQPENSAAIALPAALEPDLQLMQQHLYFRKAGIALGEAGAKEWIPAHELALSLDHHPNLPAAELDRTNALRYLKKEDFDYSRDQKGWVLMRYEGNALGWVKELGNRTNNYLPKNWRIRMEIDF
jgi:16S rRNA C967 or C1407 C5-methylase (RsmB/RsmF family)/NOL1/NOP2/fmu family ribosome biogenesis protein